MEKVKKKKKKGYLDHLFWTRLIIASEDFSFAI